MGDNGVKVVKLIDPMNPMKYRELVQFNTQDIMGQSWGDHCHAVIWFDDVFALIIIVLKKLYLLILFLIFLQINHKYDIMLLHRHWHAEEDSLLWQDILP